MHFDFISNISAQNPLTWESSAFLTFDVDWAHETYIRYTIDILAERNVRSTWFITPDVLKNSSLLNHLKEHSNIELGIHPNFNPNLFGSVGDNSLAAAKIREFREILPESRAFRCHSLTQNTRLSEIFFDYGFDIECNDFIPHTSGIELRPWAMPTGVLRVPHFWEDDLAANSGFDFETELLSRSGLRVFDFHPIHVFANMYRMESYESTRPIHALPLEFSRHRTEGIGAETYLRTVLDSN